ncbi:CYTH domain-containing protein [Neobacillus sp. MER 74]|uniref:CYTH domain-containing protein n=1 Tax=Neobacillus sp. MER 74 TaxID=2939566 RepID=UPI00203E09FA|nr:CYTH domain-containing protein [Neobacillus sp. MER 74]MCM3114273.1 CYTH domain-containing protein [Neobacillus sp. MER 74]
MTQNIEIEFKNILTKNEYERLLRFFKVDKNQIFKQENHYFDTPNFSLKSKETALRIRKKGLNYEMTLKQPATVGLLETNQTISEDDAQLAIRTGKLPTGIIQRLIEESKVPYSTIEYFGSLITERVEFEYQQGLLVLDHSIYLDTEDYELEYEVENYQNGEKLFIELLEQFKIPTRLTENKIRRFYYRKYLQSNGNES